MADHVAERDGRVFVDDHAVAAEVHGGDARCVDDALDAGFAGQLEQVAGAIDVGAVHGVGIANPEAVVGGYVDDGIAALKGGGVGVGLGEIADLGLAVDAFEIGEVAGLADEEAEVGAFSGQCAGHMMAYKSGGACQEDLHGQRVS